MDSNERKDGRRRGRSYDEAFKRDAVRLVSEEKYRKVVGWSIGD